MTFPGRLDVARLRTRFVRGLLSRSVQLIPLEEKGQALVEEALILALILVVGVGALSVLQGEVSEAFGGVLASLGVLDPVANRGRN
jgi:Flp pilus assembly pilin Flp